MTQQPGSSEAPPPYETQGYPAGYQYGHAGPSAPPVPGTYAYPPPPASSGAYVYGSVAPTGAAFVAPVGTQAPGAVYYQVDPPAAPKYGTGHHGSPHSIASELDDDQSDFRESFSDKHIRHGFLKKVYGILCVQLLITGAIMSVIMFVDSVRHYVQYQSWVFITAMCVLFTLLIVLACCDGVRRKFPLNIILLLLFTAVEGVMLGAVSAFYDTETVLMAAGIVAVLVLALTLFALQTRWDFTVCGAGLFVLLICLIIFGMLCAIIQDRYADIVYASLGALLFSFYLIFDTQMMMGGKHKYSLSPEEYIFASLNLYLDIVNIFIFVLSILGFARSG